MRRRFNDNTKMRCPAMYLPEFQHLVVGVAEAVVVVVVVVVV